MEPHSVQSSLSGNGGGNGRVKGWIGSLMTVAREGGPATLVLMLLLGGLSLWFLNGQLTRQQELTEGLVQQLLAEKERQVELALKAADCGKTHHLETKADGLPYLPTPN